MRFKVFDYGVISVALIVFSVAPVDGAQPAERFAVEQTAMARGEFLELTIVLILLFELALFFMGIMH